MPRSIPNSLTHVRQDRTSLSQRAMSRALGLRPAFGNYLEKGMMLASPDELAILCDLYQCAPADLYPARVLRVMIGVTDAKEAKA